MCPFVAQSIPLRLVCSRHVQGSHHSIGCRSIAILHPPLTNLIFLIRSSQNLRYSFTPDREASVYTAQPARFARSTPHRRSMVPMPCRWKSGCTTSCSRSADVSTEVCCAGLTAAYARRLSGHARCAPSWFGCCDRRPRECPCLGIPARPR